MDTKAAPLYPARLKRLKYLVSILLILPLFFFIAGNASADFTDTFTAPDGTDLHTYNPIYNVSGTPLTIQNNSLAPTSEVFISNNNYADACMSMDWTGNPSSFSLTVRDIGNNHSAFYGFALQSDSSWLLYRTDSIHALARGTMSSNGTHNYKLCAIGNTISV
jgi:hypothetical protein